MEHPPWQVALHLYSDLITTVPFFRDCGKNFLTEVILRLRAQTLSPGDYLYEVHPPFSQPRDTPWPFLSAKRYSVALPLTILVLKPWGSR